MRILAAVFLPALLFTGAASAADLSGVLADHILQKVPPTETKRMLPGQDPMVVTPAQIYTWKNSPSLRAENVSVILLYTLGTDFWTLFISQPQFQLKDYLGTTQLAFKAKRSISANPSDYMNVYLVGGGRFKGFLAQDGKSGGKRMITLMPPGVAASAPQTAQYLK